jgi:preprotein translocase subunit SecF
MACGLGIVVLFMIAYYSKGGWVANIALLFNIFFILGILAQFNAALTLPGMAGIVLTMGMAVDANVLIYERIKEELAQGRKLVDAIRKGYERAFSSIFDSNITTFLTAMFLFVLGQGPLKGFAIVLMIGIATSFFSSVYISRVIVEWMTRKGDDSKITFATSLAGAVKKRKDYNFMGNRKIAYIFSSTVIIIGLALIAVRGLNLGVDFKGGRSYVVSFNKPVVATDVKVALASGFENAGTEVKNFGNDKVMKVTTSYLIDDESDKADDKVKAALIDGVSKFSGLQYSENDAQIDDTHFTISSSSKVGATIADDIKGFCGLSQRSHGFAELLRVNVKQRNMPTLGEKPLRDGKPDPARGAGDKGGLHADILSINAAWCRRGQRLNRHQSPIHCPSYAAMRQTPGTQPPPRYPPPCRLHPGARYSPPIGADQSAHCDRRHSPAASSAKYRFQ